MNLNQKMRQLARIEYRAKHSAREATTNVRKIFGFHSVDLAKVQEWFNEFDAAKLKKFKNVTAEYHAELAAKFPDGTDKIINSMLCQIKNDSLYDKMKTFDGRIGYVPIRKKLFVVDLFHGESKVVKLPFEVCSRSSMEFVDEERFLAFDCRLPKVYLCKFDIETLTVTELDALQADDRFAGGTLIADNSDLGKFMLQNDPDDGTLFQTANVVGDQIVLGELIQSNEFLPCVFLSNSKAITLWWALGESFFNLDEFDLETRELAASVAIPTVFNTGESFDLCRSILNNDITCEMSANRLYFAYKTQDNPWKIVVLHLETHTWFDTKIEIWDEVHKIHIDHDEMLTVITGGSLGTTTTVYRFPLKKPDTLVNLAWFAYTRRLKKTGKRGYNNLFSHLPFTCDLRLALPMGKNSK